MIPVQPRQTGVGRCASVLAHGNALATEVKILGDSPYASAGDDLLEVCAEVDRSYAVDDGLHLLVVSSTWPAAL